jgi:hypothetical protein
MGSRRRADATASAQHTGIAAKEVVVGNGNRRQATSYRGAALGADMAPRSEPGPAPGETQSCRQGMAQVPGDPVSCLRRAGRRVAAPLCCGSSPATSEMWRGVELAARSRRMAA